MQSVFGDDGPVGYACQLIAASVSEHMAISRRALLAGGTILGLGVAAPIVESRYRLSTDADDGAPDESGIIGLWTFDEVSGDVVRDTSGHLNNGMITSTDGSRPTHGTGDFAGSAVLGGEGNVCVRVPASASLNSVKKHLTVAVNINPRQLWPAGASQTGYIAVVQRQWRAELHPDLFFLGYGPSGGVLNYKWHVGLLAEEPSIYARPWNRPPQTGKWTHLAGVYNGMTGEMSLYVDGERIASETHKGQIRLDPESLSRPLTIGAELNSQDVDDTSGVFNGFVDEVRLYNRALSGDEIAALAENAKARSTKAR